MFPELGEGTDVIHGEAAKRCPMVSGVASTLPNLAVKPKRRGQSLVELPLISPSIADRLARRAPNSYMLSGKQMEVPHS
jgi:hypothetical protein